MGVNVDGQKLDLSEQRKAETEKLNAVKRHLPGLDLLDEQEDIIVAKKTKTDAEEIIEAEMLNCEQILKDVSGQLHKKMKSLTQFFDNILKNNVNTAVLKDDFPTWVKDAILIVLTDIQRLPEELFPFLIAALKVAPTSFESISEKVLTICIFNPRKNVKVQCAYDEFMQYLVSMFDRLRRFPKLIAKFLLCVRNYFTEHKNVIWNEEDEKFNSDSILSSKFMESIGPVVNLLPSGQVIDLWKTLFHNLEIECVKPICDGKKDDVMTRQLFSIVTNLFVEVLSNTKMTDYTVPGATVEKIADVMLKLRDDCLKRLGMTILARPQEEQLVEPFLKLAYNWGQLHGILLCYNPKYKIDRPSIFDGSSNSTDLVYMHPYLKSEDWMKMGKRIFHGRDLISKEIMVRLVAQKLTYMTAFEQKNNCEEKPLVSVNQDDIENGTKAHHQLLKEERLKTAAEFIWTNQEFIDLSEFDETLTLVGQYIDSQKMIELAGNFVKQIPSSLKESNQSCSDSVMLKDDFRNLTIHSVDPRFHYAMVLEAIGEVMRRVGKMKLLSKSIKNILSETLSTENRAELLEKPTSDTKSKAPTKIVLNLLRLVNSLIDKKSVNEVVQISSEEFSSELIIGMLKFIGKLELENYPKDLKTIVFLCALVILLALIEQQVDDTILNVIAKIVIDSGSHSLGNEIIFSMQWINFYKCFSSNINRFDSDVQKNLLEMILANIYVSPKLVSEFEEELYELCESFDFELTTRACHVSLIALQFFLKELEGTKTKLTVQLQNHTRKLTQIVVDNLSNLDDISPIGSNAKKTKKITSSSSTVSLNLSNVYRACWLSQLSVKIITEVELSTVNSMLSSKVKSALSLVKSFKRNKDSEEDSEEQSTFIYAMKFLHSVCKSIEELKDHIPSNFVIKLWKASINQTLWTWSRSTDFIIPKHLIRNLYEAADLQDFQDICTSIVSLTATLTDSENVSYYDIRMVTYLLDELVEAELGVDKKQVRRKTLEKSLHAMLPTTLLWTSESDSLQMNVLPYIQFQTKLLRRRGAMVNLPTFAVCLTSVTSVPLNNIDDLSIYRNVFYNCATLLNSFAVHRLDVLSLRSHVYLQSFQYLIESLSKKADQKNKLTDEEIYDLRHCAHSIERICQSVKLGQKEFSRVSPYFVAVLMRQFEIFTVYPAVKNSLLNGSYKLLDICDEHAIAQLNAMLTIGSREVFKTVYELYKKYYQYKGRV